MLSPETLSDLVSQAMPHAGQSIRVATLGALQDAQACLEAYMASPEGATCASLRAWAESHAHSAQCLAAPADIAHIVRALP